MRSLSGKKLRRYRFYLKRPEFERVIVIQCPARTRRIAKKWLREDWPECRVLGKKEVAKWIDSQRAKSRFFTS